MRLSSVWEGSLGLSIATVYEDVIDEYISVGRAGDIYGVVVDAETMTLDRAASEVLRSSMG